MLQPVNHKFNIYTSEEFESFKPKKKVKRKFDISTYRYHQQEDLSVESKVKIGAGAILGTLIPLALIAKHQNKHLFNIKYGIKEMTLLSLGGIAGGVLSGIAVDKKEYRKQKVNEGVFQFMNAAVPPLLVLPVIKLCEKVKSLNNTPVKAISTLGVLFGGMKVAADLSNLINDPKDLVPDRKLTIKDAAANIDDALGIFVLAKMPFAKYLHVEKILPAIYIWCGYRAGESN
ncbi:MAG: hypothetical protein ACLSWI_02835 [Candidatus Gastranaerophilaceae bacterium]